jgi:hypothetical protein
MKKEFVIARGPAGVYAGYLIKENNKEVELEDCFCLWYYSGAASLSQLAMEGVKKPDQCKFSISVPIMRLKDVFQIIPCSEEARENLLSVKRWKL